MGNLLEALCWLAGSDGKKAKAIFVGGERTEGADGGREGIKENCLLRSLARSLFLSCLRNNVLRLENHSEMDAAEGGITRGRDRETE